MWSVVEEYHIKSEAFRVAFCLCIGLVLILSYEDLFISSHILFSHKFRQGFFLGTMPPLWNYWRNCLAETSV